MNIKTNVVLLALSIVAFNGYAEEPEATSPPKSERPRMGLFIEPALTYERSDTSINYPAPFSSSKGKADGFGLGARLGFHINEVFFLGVDGRYSMPTFKDSSVNYDAKSVSTNWGPVAGIQMPIVGLRVWGGIILGGNLNPDSSGNLDINFKDTSGYRVGAGFRVLPISLNIEYQHLKYGESILERVGPFSPTTTFSNVALTNNSWVVSVSFPVEL
jgi:hypothetical protein